MNVVKLGDKNYPKLLGEIGDKPKQLYYKGDWTEEIFKNCLAVVGSRKMTSYGKNITEQLVSELATKGITIVSGFMYGVDATAHKAALDANGKTIAVMPFGVNVIHPEYQDDLYNEILEKKSLIVSEVEDGLVPGASWAYPRRNRIVAGLSQAVLVVEAAQKSGSLITAELAKKYKRKLFTIPGPIGSKVSEGTNKLLKEGAELVTSAEDILDFYKVKFQITNSKLQNLENLSAEEKNIVELIENEGLEIDELVRRLKMPVAKLGTILSTMQIKGIIKEEMGRYKIK